MPVRRVTSSRGEAEFSARGGKGNGVVAAADEGGNVGLWETRGHLSVNGFCNWESVKLPNRPVHLLTLLNELDQPSRIVILSLLSSTFYIDYSKLLHAIF